MLHNDFLQSIGAGLHTTEQGNGRVIQSNGQLNLTVHPTDAKNYSNAQITSYDAARKFSFTPPLRMTIRAYSPTPADQIKGTGGFGFWNHPFSPTDVHWTLPQALWFFFSSPESNMAFADGVNGHGWKAATFNAARWQFLSLLPTAPLAIPLMNIPAAYDALWHIGQRAIGVSEATLDLRMLNQWHTYTLEWLPDKVIFRVDADIVLEATEGISHSPLGFVAWLDNQYAIVTPKGQFGFGLVDVLQTQSLVLDHVTIERL